jgi:hypothetical protein
MRGFPFSGCASTAFESVISVVSMIFGRRASVFELLISAFRGFRFACLAEWSLRQGLYGPNV